MSDFAERIARLSQEKLALLVIDQQRRLDKASEPIAVIGMGCRFPGGSNSSAEFWRFLSEGRDAVSVVPESRWPAEAWYDADPKTPGRMTTTRGAFLDDVDQFDPRFFNISPREAVTLDPQQRLLMEVAWEALEDAAVAPDRLLGSRTGVFVGLCAHDYAQILMNDAPDEFDAYVASGGSHAVAAGRLSYALGLQGPSLAVDTACSASLMAVHLAVQSLRADDCDMALAGGVNVILSPVISVILSKAGMLSPDGRCKFGDAAADGYVRGEGCGIVVLKRLSAARQAGDPILAVIRSSAVNQDGRSSGLTVPNGPAQSALIREAVAQAGVNPAEIGLIEAHGTGTSLGDPIELQALGAALGADRKNPLLVGSVKSNFGHLEAAAGVAGLIKLILALQHAQVPPSLHVTQPTPHADWSGLGIEMARKLAPWPQQKRIGGVSSFGFSGTNVHVVVEAPDPIVPPRVVATSGETTGQLFILSARDEQALRELAARWADAITNTSYSLETSCRTAALGRAHFNHRLACVVHDRAELVAKLKEFSSAQHVEGLCIGEARGPVAPGVEFAFASECPPELKSQITAQWRAWGVAPNDNDSEPKVRVEISAASDGRARMLDDATGLFVQGVPLDWAALFGAGERAPSMPTYPFQRQRYWADTVRPMTPDEWGKARSGSKSSPAESTDDWLYEIHWPVQALSSESPARDGQWLFLSDSGGVAAAAAAMLESRGEKCVRFAVEELDLFRLAAGLRTLGVVDCRALDAPPIEQLDAQKLMASQTRMLGQALELVQSIIASGETPRVWFVTRGAVAVDSDLASPQQAGVCGFAKSVAMEYPDFACTQLDLDSSASIDQNAQSLAEELIAASGETEVAWRAGKRHVARLRRAAPQTNAPQFKGACLITGGLGGLGLAAAEWLAGRGATHIALLGRRDPKPEARAKIDQMKRAGAQVITIPCDASDAAQLEHAIGRVQSELGPLRTVIHAAGVLDDAVLVRQNVERFERVLLPKISGAWNLHCLTRHLPLEHFVMYSSGASLMGSPGQANYCAANAFLDGLAHWRRAQGLPALSINWGPWAEVGVAAHNEAVSRNFSRAADAIPLQKGLDMLGRLMGSDASQIGVLPIRWPDYFALWPKGAPAFYEEMAQAAPTQQQPAGLNRDALLEAPPERRFDLLLEHLCREIAGVLGFGNAVEPRSSILDFGFDSLMAVQLSGRLASLGLSVSVSRLLEGPSADDLAKWLLESVAAEQVTSLAPTAGNGKWEEGEL